MVRFEIPKEYINRPEILKNAGKYINKFGQNAFIIGSEKSFEVVSENLFQSLNQEGIVYTQEYFFGYPTKKKAEAYAFRAKEQQTDLVIGIGGGRVIDTAKVVGSIMDVPVVTIPTIAATCASWAAVSILYNDQGQFVEPFFNPVGPRLILADTKILLKAPVRYLYAGVIDTFAKWYEISPYLNMKENDTALQVMADIAKRAFDILNNNTEKAVRQAQENHFGEAAIQTIDAIIFLAGLTGSIQTGTLFQGIAHPFYNVSTFFPETHHLLHGEKVGFGLLLQQSLQSEDEALLKERIVLFSEFDNVFTLGDLNLKDQEKVHRLAEMLWNGYKEAYAALGFGQTIESIESGMFQVEDLLQEKGVKPF